MAELDKTATDLIPAWLLSFESKSQNTSRLTLPDLKIILSIPEDWPKQPEVLPSPIQSEAIFRGNNMAEFLVIAFMPNAIPGHDMRQWLDLSLAMTGFPDIHIAQAMENPPRLLWWPEIVSSPELANKMKADEAHRNSGQALLNGEAVRLFVLMIRKGELAWKIFLSIPSEWEKHEDALKTIFDDYTNAARIYSSIKVGDVIEEAH